MANKMRWAVAALGWLLFFYHIYLVHSRTPTVKLWAESAYDEGRSSGEQIGHISEDAIKSNRDFAIDAVLKAHLGAWDKWDAWPRR